MDFCRVCGEKGNGRYFGAIVCLPCKSFFIRCTKDTRPRTDCSAQYRCDVIGTVNRMRCQFCRYQKCLDVGMARKEKAEIVHPLKGEELCRICSDIANGIHFGVISCEGCKKFFRRALKEFEIYKCRQDYQCSINPRNRNECRYCRYNKCIVTGMSRKAIRMGRPKKNIPVDIYSDHEILKSYADSIDCDISNSSLCGLEDNTTKVNERCLPFKIDELWQNNVELCHNIDIDEVNDILTSLGTQIGSIGQKPMSLSARTPFTPKQCDSHTAISSSHTPLLNYSSRAAFNTDNIFCT